MSDCLARSLIRAGLSGEDLQAMTARLGADLEPHLGGFLQQILVGERRHEGRPGASSP
jgi:hypothetical protein